MELKDVDLSFYNLQVTRLSEELNTIDMVHNGKLMEIRLRPCLSGTETFVTKLLQDASFMSKLRTSKDNRVMEAFDQLKIVMALTHE